MPMKSKSASSFHAKREKGALSSQVVTTLKKAKTVGLMKGEKLARISARINPNLVEQAKKQTGIETDTQLVEFALATIALEDNFPETMKRLQGSIDPDIKLGY